MQPKRGTGFTNINRILQANQGNKLGQTVSSGIQQSSQNVMTGIQQAQQKFQDESQKNRLDTPEAKEKREAVLGRFGEQQAQQPQSGVSEQPSPIVSDSEIKDFTKFRTGTYTGPQQLQDVGTLFGKAQQAQQVGDLTRSSGGRQELLRQFVGGGREYTSGQKRLDETLLGQDNTANLGAAARQTRGSLAQVERANLGAQNLAQEYVGRAKEFGKETLSRIGETREPISTQVDTRLTQAQQVEQKRQQDIKQIQDLLSGAGEFSRIDPLARTGLALQSASDMGFLTPGQVQALTAQGGLISRGAGLGLDLNSLINERLKVEAAQGLSRQGLASEDERAKLIALDRLAGKVGPDVEFSGQADPFQLGRGRFDLESLDKYISQTEAERARADAAFAAQMEAERMKYLNQALAYAGLGIDSAGQVTGNMIGTDAGLIGTGVLGGGALAGVLGNASAAGFGGVGAGGALSGAAQASPYALAAMLATDMLTGSDTTSQTYQGLANTGIGAMGAGTQGTAAVLEGLNKLNIGGKSLSDTTAGQQLANAIKLYSDSSNKVLGEASKYSGNIGDSISDLARLDLGGAASNIGAIPLDIAKNISNEIARAASNPVASVGRVFKRFKISDEDNKENIKYDQKDVENFMNRLKASSYDYKKEVQDSPLASKNREIGVMAQDLEKSKLGKESVKDTKIGKVVDYDNLGPKMLASIANINDRLKQLEGK